MSHIDKILVVTEKLKTEVKNYYGKSDVDIKSDVDTLNKWLIEQPHLPHIKDDDYMERVLMKNQFDVKKTKKQIDLYFTLKTAYSEYFDPQVVDVKSQCVQNVNNCMYTFMLKNPTNNNERIIFFKIKDAEKLENMSIKEMFQWYILVFEIASKYDYCKSTRYVGDMKDFSLNFFKKFNLSNTPKGAQIVQEGFSHTSSTVEYINAPDFVESIIKFFEPLLKNTKIVVNKDIEDLCKKIPRECLPDEYGGKSGKLQDIQDAWIQEIATHKDYLIKRFQLKSDESKRIEKSKYSEMFGTDGNFKNLNLD